MQLTDFRFDLPPEQIAQQPLPERSASRLLVLDGDQRKHLDMRALPSLLRAGDHLVFNDTRVIPARLLGQKATGGRIEVFLERVLGPSSLLAKVRASKSPRVGSKLLIGETTLRVLGRQADLFELDVELGTDQTLDDFIEGNGDIPLPPYIERAPDSTDVERYQTIYASAPGAVAAPTAGLHFDEPLFEALAEAGITHSFITLHVGAGTFQPVRVDELSEHHMHAERVTVTPSTVASISAAREAGGRCIAVGTTSVRALEAASESGTLEAFSGETALFLTPGSRFHTVDGLLTNFHLPESTLLMLVCAFAGHRDTLSAYRDAVQSGYRFFSYGDAMLAWPATRARPTEFT